MKSKDCKKTILAVVDWYLPGFKAGGPVRSVSNLIAALGEDNFHFYVLTRDHDHTEKRPYDNVPRDAWVTVGKADVFYSSSVSFFKLRRVICELKPEIVYLNSFFSRFTIRILLLRWFRLLPRTGIIVAPRGEFSPGALGIKKAKKFLFLRLASLVGLYRNILWHASANREQKEIQAVFSDFSIGLGGSIGVASPIHVASDMPEYVARVNVTSEYRGLRKCPGQASFVFVSRVSPKKNVCAAIEMLSNLTGEISFDIYGPVDDQAYFGRCKKAVARASQNVRVRFMGPLRHEEVRAKFRESHFFLFPTLGENFGHIIVESFGAGCPVIISDETPWSDLHEYGIGWDLPLKESKIWHTVLQKCVDMGDPDYQAMSHASTQFVSEWISSPRLKEENLALFHHELLRDSLALTESSF